MDQNLIKQNLQIFSKWAKEYCNGTERANAQIFLNKFFQAFGYDGVLEAGAKFEDPLRKASQKGKTGFADCIFAGNVLIEMKKRDTDLVHHYNQLETYWTKCTPKPKYAMLCNFDEFWIYDFNIQVDSPIQVIPTEELHKQIPALAFMLGKTARFNRNIVEITQKAVHNVTEVYKAISSGQRKKYNGITDEDARRFILQCVFCMFSEDIDLLPTSFFGELLEEAKKNPSHSYNLLSGLFQQMNSKTPAKGGRYKDIKYFNGGLFNKISAIELTKWEIETLLEASNQDWTAVKPSIFGTILESTMDSEERHSAGVHYTSDIDIYKIINPTIVRYWDQRIEEADNNTKKLKTLLKELRNYKVLDPACGSGNFLYIAYQEIKRIEKEIIEKIGEQASLSLISPVNFYGIDIKPFAVELAKLTLEIGRTVAIKKLKLTEENPLPLENLDQNIICADALFTEWPEVNAIIGNPPFFGHYKASQVYGDKYFESLPDKLPGQPDLCTYWFRKAHTQKTAERIGLVGTNSISQGQSRKASLDFIIANGGIIHNAVSTQEWSGEAAVHVSIVNWVREQQKQNYLDEKPVSFINSSLKCEIDVTQAHRLKQNQNKSFKGVEPTPVDIFAIDESTYNSWIEKDFKLKNIVRPMISADTLTDSVDFSPSRYLIDFGRLSSEQAKIYKIPFMHLKVNSDKIKRANFWQLSNTTKLEKISALNGFICIPHHSKWYVPVIFKGKNQAINNSVYVIDSDDYYILGVLTSKLHRDWVKAQCSTLEDRIRYTNTTCFETFPFLWEAKEKLKEPVREIMKKLDEFRLKTMKEKNYGMTKLYNEFFSEPASKLSKLHKALDEAACKVYGWKYDSNKNYNQELFELNQELFAELTS